MLFGKLVAMLAHAKGASVAIVVTVSAATATVGAATPEVQDAVREVAAAVGVDLTGTTHGANALRGCDDQKGQPAVVAQRNAADKLVRAAYEADRKALQDLRGGKDVDNRLVGEIVRKYDDQLRDTMNKALSDVAALTLGREGQVRKAAASASPSASPAGSASPKPSCTPKPSPTAAVAVASPSPDPSASPTAEPKGRVAVANRTTLDAELQSIVDKATEDMDALVEKATDEAAEVPALERGKPSDNPNKPENQGGRPSPKPTR
jgi:hypothetical protein